MQGSDLDRLLRAAAQADATAPASAPFGFDTRVVAQWRASRNEKAGSLRELAQLVRRIAIGAALVTVVATAGAYWQVSQNDEASEPLSNSYAMADNAIEADIFQ